MNARRGIVSGLIMAAAVAALPEGGPGPAQALGTKSETVNKVVVKFSDLNLHREMDAKRLLRRIRRAAVHVCRSEDSMLDAHAHINRAGYRRCIKNSTERAQKTLLANLDNRAKAALKEGDLEKADDMHRRLLTLHKVLEQKEDMVEEFRTLSDISVRRSDLETAAVWRERALALNRELERPEQVLADLDRMGWITRNGGNLDAAQDHYRQALVLSAELNREDDMAGHIRNLGLVAAKRGDFDTAETLHRSSLALHRLAGRREDVAAGLADLGRLARARGDIEGAKQFHHHALALHSDLGGKKQMAVQHSNLWPLALEQNRLDEAEVHLQQAVRLANEAGVLDDAPALGEVQMGLIRLARGNRAGACAAWGRAQTIYRGIGNETESARVREMMRDSQCPAVLDPSVTAALK